MKKLVIVSLDKHDKIVCLNLNLVDGPANANSLTDDIRGIRKLEAYITSELDGETYGSRSQGPLYLRNISTNTMTVDEYKELYT